MKPRRRSRSRRWWGRRGISTVVANVMMIGITLSLGAILIAWAGQSYGAFGGGSQLFFQQRGQALQENFVIEEVYFTKSSSQIYVFVRNVGLININVVAIYANGTSLTPQSGGTCTFSGSSPASTSMGVGQVCEFQLNWPTSSCSPNYCPWVTGDIFIIVVASQRGNQAASTWRAP